MRNVNRTVLLLTIGLCGSTAFAKIDVTVSESGQIKNLKTNTTREIEKDTPTSIQAQDPVAIYSNQGIPVILIPQAADGSQIHVDVPARESYEKLAMDVQIDAALGDVLENFTKLQALIMQKKTTEARGVLQTMRAKHKNVQFLNFLEASIDLIEGNRGGAVKALKQGLKAHPNYKEGVDLLRELEGKP